MSSESVINNFKDLNSFIESPQGKVLISKKLGSRYYKILISNEKFCVIQKENERGFFSFINPVEEDVYLLFEIDENGMIKINEVYDEKKLFREIEKIIVSNDFIFEDTVNFLKKTEEGKKILENILNQIFLKRVKKTRSIEKAMEEIVSNFEIDSKIVKELDVPLNIQKAYFEAFKKESAKCPAFSEKIKKFINEYKPDREILEVFLKKQSDLITRDFGDLVPDDYIQKLQTSFFGLKRYIKEIFPWIEVDEDIVLNGIKNQLYKFPDKKRWLNAVDLLFKDQKLAFKYKVHINNFFSMKDIEKKIPDLKKAFTGWKYWVIKDIVKNENPHENFGEEFSYIFSDENLNIISEKNNFNSCFAKIGETSLNFNSIETDGKSYMYSDINWILTEKTMTSVIIKDPEDIDYLGKKKFYSGKEEILIPFYRLYEFDIKSDEENLISILFSNKNCAESMIHFLEEIQKSENKKKIIKEEELNKKQEEEIATEEKPSESFYLEKDDKEDIEIDLTHPFSEKTLDVFNDEEKIFGDEVIEKSEIAESEEEDNSLTSDGSEEIFGILREKIYALNKFMKRIFAKIIIDYAPHTEIDPEEAGILLNRLIILVNNVKYKKNPLIKIIRKDKNYFIWGDGFDEEIISMIKDEIKKNREKFV